VDVLEVGAVRTVLRDDLRVHRFLLSEPGEFRERSIVSVGVGVELRE
jgi:hypothetical protein